MWNIKDKLFIGTFFLVLWVGGGYWLWRKFPSDEELARKILREIELTLKQQKYLVETMLLEESMSKTPSPEIIRRLKELKEILDPISDDL